MVGFGSGEGLVVGSGEVPSVESPSALRSFFSFSCLLGEGDGDGDLSSETTVLSDESYVAVGDGEDLSGLSSAPRSTVSWS